MRSEPDGNGRVIECVNVACASNGGNNMSALKPRIDMKTDPYAPAFPTVSANDNQEICTGLTKREEFAKAAMQGFLAGNKTIEDEGIARPMDLATIALASVRQADALIAKLNK